MKKIMDMEAFCIDIGATVLDAMKKIDANGQGIIYVLNQGKMAGLATDGDIRRFILNKGDLNALVDKIMNRTPLVLPVEREYQAHEVLRENKITSIPILGQDGKLCNIIFFDDWMELKRASVNIPTVIMAGGEGTRLYPYTKILPKPLIPIGEKTITEHIMDRFQGYGCNEFTMIVNYKKHFVKSYFLDSEKEFNVKFIEEETFLGTGGGLKFLEGKFSSTFFLTNCDILIEEDYAQIFEYHKKNGNLATMVCAVKNMTIPYGTVELAEDGSAVHLTEKPQLSFITNTGFYVLEPEFIREIPSNTFIHITDILQKCIDEGKKVGVYKIPEENWLDMGQLEELEMMKKRLNVE